MDIELLRQRCDEIVRCAAKHGAGNVRVFGSIARGETVSGDIDLLVDMERGRSLLDLVALEQELEGIFGTNVDVLSDGGISPYLRDRIYAEAVPLAPQLPV